ncbi:MULTISPECIES: HPr kinase/phosphorylase [Xanthobacter]|uniref:HPr kinase/phosphatase C-terminal domain-containing protein n=1 Tax=Xanthobacter aminoxidans TaxID=186280 RepID=A0ABW6ZIZ0_9HYPH|nr:HPr kinase/phosphatase C-terminal domain-containing protein [Xanthobacter sp. 91]
MTGAAPPTIHASCVAVGDVGLLIRGPSGSGKSMLALRLILDAPRALPPAELVADDRVVLAVEDGMLIARPPPLLAGLIELRGIGVRRMEHRPSVAVRHVVDLAASEMVRMPDPAELREQIQGIEIPRTPIFSLDLAPVVIACILKTRAYEN